MVEHTFSVHFYKIVIITLIFVPMRRFLKTLDTIYFLFNQNVNKLRLEYQAYRN